MTHMKIRMMNKSITDILNKELVNYASYDNLRKIGSCVDGLKNASRKVMFTIHEKKIKEKIKVSQLSAKCAEYSDYLHGDTLWGVIVTLGRDYTGTNNIPLIKKFGNFGTRCINESSAPRYIFAKGSDEFFNIFKHEDDDILEQQYFEGNRIEPKFYVPTLPMLLVNGSEGVSSGFAQKILSRNPESIKKYICELLKGKTPDVNLLTPWFKDFAGTIERDSDIPNKWYIKGVVRHLKNCDYLIDEIPFTYDLKSYLKVLDDLQDDGVINRYVNLSDGENVLKFKVSLPRNTEGDLLEKLKLIKTVTENYTCIDDNNRIKEFSNVKDIIDYYMEVKLRYLDKRKISILNDIGSKIDLLEQKIKFLTCYISKKIKIDNTSIDNVVIQLEKLNLKKVDDSYSYLLNMPLYTLTKEHLQSLQDDLKNSKEKYKTVNETTIQQMWISDIKYLK